ncbi:PAS domain S-box protein [Geminicoccaceae bacterium 1502E]|nr:PAS domain S-box protein [Geminicoccaceae bacterium 1502E]
MLWRRQFLLLTLAALLPLLGLVAGLTILSLRQQQASMRIEAVDRAGTMLGSVERDLLAQVELLQVLARTPALDGPTPDLARFRRTVAHFREELPAWANVILAGLDGQQIVNMRHAPGRPLPPVVDPKGFARVLATGRPVVGDLADPRQHSPSGQPRFSVKVPVLRDGEVRYVLTATVDADVIASSMLQPGLAPSWRVLLVDAAGRIVAAPETPASIGEAADEPALAALADAREGVYETVDTAGEPFVTAFRRSQGTGWSAHVAIPLEEYAAPLERSTWRLVGVGLAACALSLILVCLLRRVQERAEARKAAILEAALDAIATVGTDGRVLEWNAAAERMFGYRREEAARRAIVELAVPPEDRRRHQRRIARLLRRGGGRLVRQRVEIQAMRADGSRFPLELALSPFSIGGRPYLTLHGRDITSRKRGEAELKESEQRYRLLAENATDMIGRLSLDGVCLYVSPACREIMGYEPAEILGRRLADHVHPEDREEMVAELGAFLAGRRGLQHTLTYRMARKDGRHAWLEVRLRLVQDAVGRPLEAVGVGRDITQRRDLEQRLHEAQKMKAVGQLTGGVAHDFNNLLTVILGNAEVLAAEIADPRLRALALMVQEAAERGADLTDKLLTFGRRRPLTQQRLDLNTLVRGMISLLRRTIGAPVALRTELPEGLPSALADRALLEGALLNLVLNARDAMPHGGVLTIATGIERGRAGRLFVSVADTGTGMSQEVRERAFEPFFTTKEAGKGSGLGLPMVYGFARLSGGEVAIETEPGRGTTVLILLPLAAAQPDGRSAGAESGPVAAAAGPDQGIDLALPDIVQPEQASGVELARRAPAPQRDLRLLPPPGQPGIVAELPGPDELAAAIRKARRARA